MTRGVELRAVMHEGKRIRTEHLDVRAAASLLPHLEHPRVGFIVPKHKQSGVARNRLKRRLRELARLRLLPALAAVPVDVVVRVRPEAYAATFAELERELARVTDKLRDAPRASRRDPPPRRPRGDRPAAGDTRPAPGA